MMNRSGSLLIFALLTVCFSLLVSGCGGDTAEETPAVPANATATAAGPTDKPPAQKTVKPGSTTIPGEKQTPDATDEEAADETPTADDLGLTAEIVSGEYAGAGKPFTFDATQSEAGESPIEAYEWDMGDGTYLFGLAIQHAYSEPGEYTVTLTVVDEDGQRDSVSQVVEIVPLADLATPTAIGGDPTTALIGTSWLMDKPMRGTIITLNFDEDMLSGSSGCNSYNATYTVVAAVGPASSISVGVISGTSHSCTLEIMAQEKGYLDVLAAASNYHFEGDTLIMETTSGTLTFSPATQ